jgi:branched-subunit amino acid transport protein
MTGDYLLLIIGMGIVTYIPRLIPILFLSHRDLPSWLIDWLDYIPVALLSALIFPTLLTSGDPKILDVTSPEVLVAIPTFIIAFRTRSLAGTVIVGMLCFWLVEKFFF